VAKAIVVLVVAGWATLAQATTYNYSGLLYSSGAIENFTPPCFVGPCANYTGGMSIRGSFTTISPLSIDRAAAPALSIQATLLLFALLLVGGGWRVRDERSSSKEAAIRNRATP
jgi:hypothetical protein